MPVPEPVTTTPAAPLTAAPAPAPVPAPTPDEIRAEERERISAITFAGRTLGRPQAEVDAAIAAGTKVKHYHRSAIEAVAAGAPAEGGVLPFNRQDPRIEPGQDQRDKLVRGMTAWMIERAGVADDIDAAMKAKPRLFRGWTYDADAGEFRGMTLVDMARECLERAGTRTETRRARPPRLSRPRPGRSHPWPGVGPQ